MTDVQTVPSTASTNGGDPLQGGGWLLAETPAEAVFTREDCTAEQVAIARAAREFVEGEILPRSDEIEHLDQGATPGLLRKAGELGLLGVGVPEAYGGLGLDLVTSALVTEELGRQASFAVSAGAHAGIGTLPLVYFGTEEQKRKYLPRVATGAMIAAYALSEAGYGSDALRAATRARLSDDGGHYVLNGTKMWTSNAGFADLFTVFAQVEGGAADGRRTFSAFLVERGFAGVSIGREEHKLGIKGSSTCRVILEDARIPAENLLHQVGRGHVVALNVLNQGRLRLAVGLIGPARDLIGISARYANEREQMGHPISHYGLIQQKLAEQAARLFATEAASYRVCGMVTDQMARLNAAGPGEDGLTVETRATEEFLIECAMLKVQASEMLDYVVDEAVQIHGGYGYTEEFPVARAYRDSRINRIFEGTNEINRLTVAGTLLRRAQQGRLPLIPAIGRIAAALLEPPSMTVEAGGVLAEERRAVRDAMQLTLVAAGAAAERYGEGLIEQQEVLGAVADMAIDAFAAESSLLRAAKLAPGGGERAELAATLAKIFTADALDRIQLRARQVLTAVLQGDELRARLALLRRLQRTLPTDTIALRRQAAAKIIASEGYLLS